MSKRWGPKPIEDQVHIDPDEVLHGPVRTLKDMTEEEILVLEKHYGMKIRRPNRE
jgi:hypothetical protein